MCRRDFFDLFDCNDRLRGRVSARDLKASLQTLGLASPCFTFPRCLAGKVNWTRDASTFFGTGFNLKSDILLGSGFCVSAAPALDDGESPNVFFQTRSKRFQITAREPQSCSELVGAFSGLYRSRSSQVNALCALLI